MEDARKTWVKNAKPILFKVDNGTSFVTLGFGKHSMPNDRDVANTLGVDEISYQNVLKDYGAKIDKSNGQHYFIKEDKALEALKWLESLWVLRRLGV